MQHDTYYYSCACNVHIAIYNIAAFDIEQSALNMQALTLSLGQADLPLFVKVENVPEQEVVSSESFSRSTVWFNSQVCLCLCSCMVPYA